MTSTIAERLLDRLEKEAESPTRIGNELERTS